MSLHIGNGITVPHCRIIGIFDLDGATQSNHSRAFLARAEREGIVSYGDEDIPRSFVLCTSRTGEVRILLSRISAAGLQQRLQSPVDDVSND